ncbi:MAG: flagellar filament capping protein FliD, partial [Bacteroidetes bacterium]|nr:flagellar filament capping protein FliD [Bacteroidota bacterium]
VIKMFTQQGATSDQNGVAVKLYNTLGNAISRVSTEAGASTDLVDTSYLGTQITNLNTEISGWDRKLNDAQNRYWSQFTAMEKAISQMNSQSSWFSQQLGRAQ